MVTTAEFLSKVKATALTPTYQITYSDADILDFATEEMDELIVPFITSLRAEYFVKKTSIPMVIGEDTLDIPERAVGRTIREIKYMLSGSTQPQALLQASISENYAFNTVQGVPQYHYFEGDSIKISPVPDKVYGDYWLWYEARPNRLVTLFEVGVISSVGASTLIIQQNLNKDIKIGSLVDIYKVKNGYSNIYTDIIVGNISTGIGSKTIALAGFSAGSPITGVNIGDHIALAWKSATIQLPDEAVSALVQATVVRMMQGQDQENQLISAGKSLDRCLKNLAKALTPRNEGSYIKLRPRSPMFGPGRRSHIFGVGSN